MSRRLRSAISPAVNVIAVLLWVCVHSISAQIQACCPPFLISPTAVYVGLNGNDTQGRLDNGQPTAKVITGPVQWMVMPSKAPCAQADHRFFYELPTNTGGSSESRYGYPAPLPTPYLPAPISPVNVFNQRFAPYGTPFPNAYGATNGFYGGQTPIVPQTGGEDGYQEENGENAFGASPTAEAYQLGYMMGQQQAGQQAPQFSPSRATPLFPRKELTPRNPFQPPTTAPRRPIATLYGTDPGPDRVAQSQVLDSGGSTADNEGFILNGVTRSIVSTVTPNGTEFNATDDLIAEVEQVGFVTLSPSKRKHVENSPDEQTDYTEGFSTTWTTSLENSSTTQGPRAQAFATKLLEEEGRGINAVYTSSANNGFFGAHLLLVLLLTSLLA